MSATFAFAVDPVRSFVRISMSGFFTEADILRFSHAQEEAYLALRCAPNQHVTMVDMRAMHIQAKESVAAFQVRLSDPRVASRKIAFVVSKSLARMQIKRATDGLNAQLFSTEGEAEAWLFDGSAETVYVEDAGLGRRHAITRAPGRFQ
ncbi:hypothetical protein FHS94_003885 [Sphingomonas aerophila]|uniref:STAS/SEC14 domain-containing protein n=2 Tax=Sphingomonas aerophila TaxID=1344948 RepID=A0A7W9BHK7_9SPHN|nr:hypothetical protein [Sphingomonas aerophila]